MDERTERLHALADALATAGAIVGGAAALSGTLGFLVASLLRDAGHEIDPSRAAQGWAQVGGVFGLALILFTVLGLH